MNRITVLLWLGLFLWAGTGRAQVALGDSATVSLLTVAPSEEAVFTVYGHTAIRVKDEGRKIDAVFNYGLFDFNTSNFVYRFAKGETDYRLGVTSFRHFMAEYEMRGSEVTEQVLNLTGGEKARIWEALLTNALPENAVYRYNFFFDNCATRPAAIIEKSVEGEVVYHHPAHPQSFRSLINHAMRNKPWLVFGTELALGAPTQRIATQHEELFLPLYLQAAFAQATIRQAGGSERNLVSATHILSEQVPEEVEATLFTPLVAGLLLLAVVLLLTFVEWKKKAYFRWLDCGLFLVAGAGGVVLFFLAFVSVHPATWPNWQLIWLHPFHLAGVVLFAVKKFNKAAYCYHFINFAALTLMLLGWYFIPQHLNVAFIPFILCLWLRSAKQVKGER